MVKPAEVKEVLAANRFHILLMGYTAIMVAVTDFLTGVLSAIVIWVVLRRWFDVPAKGVAGAAEEPAYGD
jgi:hypothetical protein